MLVAQAKLASELFRDTKLDDGIIDRVRARIERDTHNIVLIGMPGSGKTTLGERIAERLNRRLIDTDESLLTITGGRDAASIIRNEGEAEFRRIETQAVREAGMQSGCVIATGGGVVTQSANRDPLRQNSVVFFVDRPLELLELSDTRPLSMTRAQNEALYAVRRPLYEAFCDYSVRNLDIDTAVSDIIQAFDAHFGEM